KSHKDKPSDGSFESMLDSALPDAGNERRGDDGARKSAPNTPAPGASAPGAPAPSDAPASGPGDSPSAKSGQTSDSQAKPASTTAADGKPAATKPAKAHPHHGAGTCEDEQEFALLDDAIDAASVDATAAVVTPEQSLATTPAPDAIASTLAA